MVTAAVFGVLPPVVDVDFSRASNHELQLAGIKNRNESRVNDLVESPHERLRLLLHTSLQPPLNDSLQVLLFVLLSYNDVLAARLQFLLDDPTKELLGHAERQPEGASWAYVVIADPLERLVELAVCEITVVSHGCLPSKGRFNLPKASRSLNASGSLSKAL